MEIAFFVTLDGEKTPAEINISLETRIGIKNFLLSLNFRLPFEEEGKITEKIGGKITEKIGDKITEKIGGKITEKIGNFQKFTQINCHENLVEFCGEDSLSFLRMLFYFLL